VERSGTTGPLSTSAAISAELFILQDSSDAKLPTAVNRTQVLDGKGTKGGCPQPGCSLSYYHYV